MKASIVVADEVNAFIDNVYLSDLEQLQSQLSVYKKDYYQEPAFITGAWDGKISPVGEDGRFPVYMAEQVFLLLAESGYEIDMEDLRKDVLRQPAESMLSEDMLGNGITLRWYQMDAVKAVWEHEKGILDLCTSAGKTLTCAAISKLYEPCQSIVIVPSEKLVKQTVKEYLSVGMDVGGIHGKTSKKQREAALDKTHLITTWQTLKNNRDWCQYYSVIMYDECFTGDHEILTENGWVRFDELQDGVKVAQSTIDGKIDFVLPEKVIRKPYSGDMVALKTEKNTINIDCTAGHELVVHGYKNPKKVPAKDAFFNSKLKMLTAGNTDLVGGELGWRERFAIATQADGYIIHTTESSTCVYFTFSKDRKIARLQAICDGLGVEMKEVSVQQGSSENTKPKRRFSITVPWVQTKDVRDSIGLDISTEVAKEIIEEMVQWDGYIDPKRDYSYYYSSTDKSQVDFFQAVSVLAGYTSHTSLQVDERSDEFSDVHRLFIKKNRNYQGTQSIRKTTYHYDGMVYCVRVPKGNIFVRRGGTPILIGNCHVMGDVGYELLADEFGHARIRVGLTGTVPKDKQKELWLKMHIGGDTLIKVEPHQLQEEGHIAKIDIDIYNFTTDMSHIDPKKWEWPLERKVLMKNFPRIEAMAHEIGKLPEENLLILCHPELGRQLAELLGCGFIDQETKGTDRDALCEPFNHRKDYVLVASYGTIGTGVSINDIFQMVMIDVGKNFTAIVQGAGRGMRKDSEGRMMCKIYDFYSDYKYGKKHLSERIKIYKEKQFPHKKVKTITVEM